MNTTLKISDSATVPPLAAASDLIKQLPQDLLNHIFSYLRDSDLQSAAQVSQGFNKATIKAAIINEQSALFEFTNRLTEILPEGSFKKICGNTNFNECANLVNLKGSIANTKAQLIEFVKKLDTETVNTLSASIRPPKSMEDIFELSLIERKISEANSIDNLEEREEALREIVQHLKIPLYYKKAVEVATAIPLYKEKWLGIRYISTELALCGQISKATELAMTIPEEDRQRESAFFYILIALVEANEIDNAVEVFTKLPTELNRRQVLESIFDVMTGPKIFKQAFAFAQRLPLKEDRECAVQRFSENTTEEQLTEIALELSRATLNDRF